MFFVYYMLICFKEEVYSQNQIKELTGIESGQFMKGHSGNTVTCCVPAGLLPAAGVTLFWGLSCLD